ncbi:MAG: ribosome maturation factor RimP [Candidatus Eisenbacteria bacterium]
MEVREEVRQLSAPLAEEAGYELVDVELSHQGHARILRVLLDKPGGITIGECARFSRRLADCLEMNQTVPGTYHLEVSSPGIERPIRTLDAVQRFAGQRVSLTTHELRNGRRNWEGDLLGPRGEQAGIRIEDGTEHWFEWAEVKTARLIVDPWADKRSRGGRQ